MPPSPDGTDATDMVGAGAGAGLPAGAAARALAVSETAALLREGYCPASEMAGNAGRAVESREGSLVL